MSFGKDAPPLPMYEHKVLKHVPTMIRRRYDRDLDDRFISTLGFPYEDGESRGDHDGAEASNHVAVTVSDANYEHEQIQAEFCNELDSQIYTNDTGMFSEDSRSESDGASRGGSGGAEYENIVYVGLDVAEDSRIEDNVTEDVNIVSDYVVDSVQGEVEEKNQRNLNNIQGFLSEDRKSLVYYGPEEYCISPAAVNDLDNCVVSNEVEETRTYTKDFGCNAFGQSTNDSRSEYKGAEYTNLLCNSDPNFEDETEGDEHVKSDNEQDDSKSKYKGVEVTNIVSNKDANVEDEIEEDEPVKSDNEQDDSKSESAEVEDVMDANVEDEIKGDEDVRSDNEQVLFLDKDPLENHVDSNVKIEVHQDSEQDLNVVHDSISKGNGAKDTDIVDDDVQDIAEEIDHEKSENKQDTCSEDCIEEDDDRGIDVKILANNEDASVKNEVQENDLGLNAVHGSKSQGDGTEDVDIASRDVDDSIQDEVQDSEQDLNIVEDRKSEGDETKDVDAASDFVDDNVQDKADETDHQQSENQQYLNDVEDSKSEGDGSKDVDNVQDKAEEIDHEISENEQEDCIEVDDGAIDAKIFENNEVQEKDLGYAVVHDSKSEGDETEEVDIASHDVDDSVQDEIKEKGLEALDSKQDMLVEDSKSKVDATIDANVDDSVEDEVLDIENDNKQDDSKSEGEEDDEHDDPPSYGDVIVKIQDKEVGTFLDEQAQQEFIPEAFKEILEKDGIDLCCPNCKNEITHTVIFQKKEDIQTTCCSFFTTIFSCCMPSMVAHWRTNYRSHLD